jgi:hypothetical protein
MYSLKRNQVGHALTIVFDVYSVLHLDAGTTRNEENAQQVVDVLNAAEALVEHDEDEKQAELEQAVKRLKG